MIVFSAGATPSSRATVSLVAGDPPIAASFPSLPFGLGLSAGSPMITSGQRAGLPPVMLLHAKVCGSFPCATAPHVLLSRGETNRPSRKGIASSASGDFLSMGSSLLYTLGLELRTTTGAGGRMVLIFVVCGVGVICGGCYPTYFGQSLDQSMSV